MQIAIVFYPGFTALDAVGPYEVLRLLPGAEVRFVGAAPGPVVADPAVLPFRNLRPGLRLRPGDNRRVG